MNRPSGERRGYVPPETQNEKTRELFTPAELEDYQRAVEATERSGPEVGRQILLLLQADQEQRRVAEYEKLKERLAAERGTPHQHQYGQPTIHRETPQHMRVTHEGADLSANNLRAHSQAADWQRRHQQ